MTQMTSQIRGEGEGYSSAPFLPRGSSMEMRSSSEDRIALIREGIASGQTVVQAAKKRHLVALLGNTNAGISTFANYLAGCVMQSRPGAFVEEIEVKGRDKGGPLDEIMPIGHLKQSRTLLPQVFKVLEGLTVCDCPGFFNNVALEFSVSSLFNIKEVFKEAASLKFIILINYNTIKPGRANQISALINMCTQLFGTHESLMQSKDSMLVGITHLPSTATLQRLKSLFSDSKWPNPFEREWLRTMSERMFIYDPLDRPNYEGAWKRQTILEKIGSLDPAHLSTFKTPLTAEDEGGLREIGEDMSGRIRAVFHESTLSDVALRTAASYQATLNSLEIIEHAVISELTNKSRRMIAEHFEGKVFDFHRSCARESYEGLTEGQRLLKVLMKGLLYFDESVKRMVLSFLEQSSAPSDALMSSHVLAHQKISFQLQDFLLAANTGVEKIESTLAANQHELESCSQRLQQSLGQIVERLEGEDMTGTALQQARMVFSLIKNAFEVSLSSAQQCQVLTAQSGAISLKNFQGAIEVALHVRKKEIEYIRSQFEAISRYEDHEWTLALLVHTEKLKEESQKFDQLLQIQTLQRSEKDREFDRRLEQLRFEEKELDERKQLFRQKQEIYEKHEHKLCQYKIHGFKEVYNMNVKARCQLAELFLNTTYSQ